MNFKQRLLMYLFGVGLGLILVYIFFKDREIGRWLPENRVKESISMGKLLYAEDAKCYAECMHWDENWLEAFLKDAEVNFSESTPRKKPCPVYLIEGKMNERKMDIVIEVCEKESVIEKVIIDEESCDCQ